MLVKDNKLNSNFAFFSQLDLLSLSVPKLHSWNSGLDSFDRSANSRLRRAVSMIRLKKSNSLEEEDSSELNHEDENQG